MVLSLLLSSLRTTQLAKKSNTKNHDKTILPLEWAKIMVLSLSVPLFLSSLVEGVGLDIYGLTPVAKAGLKFTISQTWCLKFFL